MAETDRGAAGRSAAGPDDVRDHEKAGAPARGRGPAKRKEITVWFTQPEWETIKERAERSGKPLGPLVRDLALGTLPAARSGTKNAALIRALGRCGTALAERAAATRADGAPAEALRLEAALGELLDLVRQLAPKQRNLEPEL